MTPPINRSPASAPENPYVLETNAGYTSIDMEVPGHTYSGWHIGTQMGQEFFVHPRHSFSLSGVFRAGSLTNEANNQIDLVHFGVESRYKANLISNFASAFVSLGVGTNIYYSDKFLADFIAPGTVIDNQSALAMTLGGGLSFFNNILVVSAAYQSNFGLQVPYDESASAPPAGLSPKGVLFSAGINLPPLLETLTPLSFPREIGFTEWAEGFNPGLVADGTYTFNLGNPKDGINRLRVFDNRANGAMANALELNAERPIDEKNPFGVRADIVFGEDAKGAAPQHSLHNDWFYLQQLYGAFRLPIHRGITLKAGQWTSPFGSEVLEGPLNNQISRSFTFNYAQQFTGTGINVEAPLTEEATIMAGVQHGWDNVVGRDAGLCGLALLTVNWNDMISTSLGGTIGEEAGRTRSFFYFLAVLKPVKDLNFTLEYNGAHETEGAETPSANWEAASLLARYDFTSEFGISARAGVFDDPDAARTGNSQTLGEFTGTLHLSPPWKWAKFLQGKIEFRHDESSLESFMEGDKPSKSQNTIGIGVGVVLPVKD